jgi:ERCC4-related helicase
MTIGGDYPPSASSSKGRIEDEDLQLALGDDSTLVVDEERRHLQTILNQLGPLSTDPKLDVVLYFLLERRRLDLGCIVFSQYYDTSRWVGECLTQRLPGETVAVYAGAGKSGIFLDSEWRSVERDQIKKAVKEHQIRMVVATDAACEGLNLQTLGTLINVDLPWNECPSEPRGGGIPGSKNLARCNILRLWPRFPGQSKDDPGGSK